MSGHFLSEAERQDHFLAFLFAVLDNMTRQWEQSEVAKAMALTLDRVRPDYAN